MNRRIVKACQLAVTGCQSYNCLSNLLICVHLWTAARFIYTQTVRRPSASYRHISTPDKNRAPRSVVAWVPNWKRVLLAHLPEPVSAFSRRINLINPKGYRLIKLTCGLVTHSPANPSPCCPGCRAANDSKNREMYLDVISLAEGLWAKG